MFLSLSSPVPCYLISLRRARVAVPINHIDIYGDGRLSWIYVYALACSCLSLVERLHHFYRFQSSVDHLARDSSSRCVCVCLSNESFLSSLLIRKQEIILYFLKSFLHFRPANENKLSRRSYDLYTLLNED